MCYPEDENPCDDELCFPMPIAAWTFVVTLCAMAASTLILLALISVSTECQCNQKEGYKLRRFIDIWISNTQCRYTAKNGTESFLYTYSPDDPCSFDYHSHNNEYCFEKKGANRRRM